MPASRGGIEPRQAPGIFIGLGSNLGDRGKHIRDALRELEERGDIRVLRVSSLIETSPVGGPPEAPDFLNAVAQIDTRLPPRDLLRRLLEIERRHGRQRSAPNAPRTLDLDLLVYGQQRIREPDLVVPHPRMWQRDFVLGPLRELCSPVQLARLRRLAPAGPQAPSRAETRGGRSRS